MIGDLLQPEITELIQEAKWKELLEIIEDWPNPEIADLLMSLDKADRVVFFRLLPRKTSSQVFAELDSEQQNALLLEMSDEETRHLLANIRPDDRTELFGELPGQATQRLLNLLSPEDLKEARQLLGYPEESIGRLMTPDYVAVRPHWRIGDAIQHIRKMGKFSETLNNIYVTDSSWKLLDALELKLLILADPDKLVEDIMDNTFVSVSATDDQEIAVQVFQRYDKFVLPVVDSEGILVGIITVDDVLDVAEEEATEDFHKTAAVAPLEKTYRETSIWQLFTKRIGWLLILVLVSLMSSGVIAAYEEVLETAIALAFFIPLLIGSAGNAGAQAATLMVRALAIDDVQLSNWLMTTGKEMLVGVFLGIVMGAACYVLGIFFGGTVIGIIVGLTMVSIIVVANIVGTLLPFMLTFFKIDPAVASSPLIATIMDATGLLIYFSIAILFIDLGV